MKYKITQLKAVPEAEKYLWLEPGDIMMSYSKNPSILARGIIFFTRMVKRPEWYKVRYSHSMVHVGDGVFISSELKVRLVPFGWLDENCSRLRVYRNTSLNSEQRKQLALSAFLYYGDDYDIAHIAGFALWAATGVDWFRRQIKTRYRDVCSTLVAHVYKNLGIYFVDRRDTDVTPDDIDYWCQTHPDQWKTVYTK